MAFPTPGGSLEPNDIGDQERHQLPIQLLAISPAESWLNGLRGFIPLSDACDGPALMFSAQLLREGCPINKFFVILDGYRELREHTLKVIIHLQSH